MGLVRKPLEHISPHHQDDWKGKAYPSNGLAQRKVGELKPVRMIV